MSRSRSNKSLFEVVSEISGGKSKQVTREDKIKQRHGHDVKHGSKVTLEDYQELTSHDNLRNLYVETEDSVSPEELNYSNFVDPVWSMTRANANFYVNSSSL